MRVLGTVGVVALFLGLFGHSVDAATYTWSNSGATWSAASDWGGALAPSGTDVGLFNSSSYGATQPNLTSTASIGAVWDAGVGTLTISGSSLTLNATSIGTNASTGIQMDTGAGPMTISSALVLGGSQTWWNNSNSLLAISGNISIGSNSLSFAGGGNASFSGLISGGGSLAMNNSGLLTLTGQNSYTGGTTVSSGTLSASAGNTANGAVGGGKVVVNNGGTITIGGDNSFVGNSTSPAKTITIYAGGRVTNLGSSTNHLDALVLSGGTLSATTANSSYGNWNFDQGVSTPGGGQTSYITGGNALLTQAGSSVFNIGGGDTLNVSTVLAHISGQTDTGLIKSGAGLMVLTGVNTYTGGTIVNGGTLTLNGNTTWNVGIIHGTATVNGGGTLIIDHAGGAQPVASTDTIKVNSGGTLGLRGGDLAYVASVYLDSSSGTAAQATSLDSGSLLRMGYNANGLIQSSGSLANTWSAGLDLVNGSGYTVAISTSAGNTLNFTGAIADLSGYAGTPLTKSGPGTLILGGTNSFTGTTTISGGTLGLSSPAGLAGSTLDTSGSGSLSFLSLTAGTLGGLQGSGSLSLTNTGAAPVALNIGANGSNTTFSGNLSGAGALVTKIGGGSLLFSGSNTYSGGTVINSGGVIFSTANSIPTGGTIAVAPGAAVGGAGYANVTAWINSGLISTTTSGAVAITGASNENIDLTSAGGGSYSTLSLGSIGNNTYTGTLTPSGSTYYLGGGGGTLYMANNGALVNSGTGARSAVVNAGLGTVTLAGSNTFTGGTSVLSGTLKLANSTALGGTSLATTIANGSALDVNGQVLEGVSSYAFTISGTGSTGSAIVNSATGNSSATAAWLKNVTLAGNTTISTGNYVGIGSTTGNDGNLNLAGYTLTKNGTGRLILNGLTMSGAGNIVVNQGALQLVYDYYGPQENVLMNGTGTLTINAGGTLTTPHWGSTFSLTMPIMLNGGTITSDWPGFDGATVASPITLMANSTMNPGGGYGAVTFSGNISGSGGLSISDPQTLTLSGSNNTFSGDTKVTGGVLQLGNPNALAGSTLDYSSYGGVLTFGSQTNAVFGGLKGSQALTLSNANSAGVALSVGNNNQNTTYSGPLGGVGGLTKIGSGTLTLSGSNTFTGVTAINAGVLQLANSNALQLSTLALTASSSLAFSPGVGKFNIGMLSGSGALALQDTSGGSLSLIVGGNGGNANYFGALSGSGNLTKAGAGVLMLYGTEAYSGGTSINAGSLLFASTAALPAAGSINVANGAAIGAGWAFNQSLLSYIAPASLNNSFTVALGVSDANNLDFSNSGGSLSAASLGAAYNATYSGTLTPAGGVYRLGGGGATLTFAPALGGTNALAISGPGAVVLANTANSYSGGTTISGGTLNISSDAVLGAVPASPTTNLTFTGNGSLQAGAASVTLSASRGIALANSATATFDSNGNSLTIGGAISGAGSIVKAGNGTLTLANTESYSGNTTISMGQLSLAFSAVTAPASNIVPSTSALTMSGGTLALYGNTSLANTQQFTAATFSSGANSVIASGGSISMILGSIARNTGATVDFTIPASGSVNTATANSSPSGGTQSILGGYATVGGSSWAVSGSGATAGNITGLALASYSTGSTAFTAATNVDPNQAGSFSVNTMTINSLRFNAAGADTVTIAASNALTIATGGLLETSGVGSNAVTITGGSLAGAVGKDLVVIQNNTSSSLSVGSIITDNGSANALTKSGAGTLTLNGTNANTFSGGTFINGGILSIGTGGTGSNTSTVSALGTGPVTVGAGGTVRFWIQNSTSFNYANAFTLNGGTLLAQDGYEHVTGTVNVGANGGTLQSVYTGKDLWIDGVLSGSGSLAVSGNSTLVHITNANDTFSGPLAINATSKVSLESGPALQYATVNLNSATATLSNSANSTLAGLTGTAGTVINADSTTRTLTVNNFTGNTYSGKLGDGTAIGNSISLVKSGLGLLLLGASDGYTGGTTVSGGTLQLGNSFALGSTSAGLTVSGGTVDLNGNNAAVGALTLVGGSILGSTTLTATSYSVQSGSINPALAGSAAALAKTTTGLVTLGGLNTYGGGTTLSAGTLQLLSGAALGASTGTLGVSGGLLDLGGNSTTLSLLSGSGGIITDNSAGAGTTTLSVSAGSFSGAIQGGPAKALALTKSGSGTLILSGVNTYSGTTGLTAGTLIVNGNNSGGDAYTVGSGATLAGTGVISGTNTVTLNSGATIVPGANTALASIGTLTLPNLSTSGTSVASFDLSGITTAGGGVNDLIAVSGNLNLAGTTTLIVNPTAGTLASNIPYTIFSYGGSLSYASSSSLVLAPGLLGPRQSSTFDYGLSTPGSVLMTITGFNANLFWVGSSSTTWDQNDQANTPWTSSTSPTGDFFASKDVVTFGNSAFAGGLTATLSGTLNPGSVTVTGTNAFAFSGPGKITNGTSLTVLGPGSLTIANSGGNDYQLGTFIQGGKIILGINNGLPIAGAVTLGGVGSSGTLDLGGYSQTVGGLAIAASATAPNQVIASSGTASSSTLTYAGPGSSSFAGTIQDSIGSGSQPLALNVAGGLLNLSGSNTYTGGTTLSGGTLQIGAPLALQYSVLTPAGGALDLGGNNATIAALSNTGTLGMTGGTLSLGANGGSSTFAGSLFGTASLDKVGSGTLVLSGSNAYTGGTTVNSGLLSFGTAGLGSTGAVAMSGGTLQWGAGNTVDLSPRLVLSDAATATFDTNGNNVTFASSPTLGAAKSAAIVKTGSGTLIFAGPNTYTGGTTVIGGAMSYSGNGGSWGGLGPYSVSGAAVNPQIITQGTGSQTDTFTGTSLTLNNATMKLDAYSATVGTNITYAFPNLTGPIQVANSTLSFTNQFGTQNHFFQGNLNFSSSNTISISNGSYQHDLYLSGNVSGSGALIFTEASSSYPHNVYITGGANAYAGTVNLSTNTGGASTFYLNSPLGAPTYTIAGNWTLNNNVAGGLNSATTVTLSAANSFLTLTSPWVNSAGTLTQLAGTVTLGSGATSIDTISAAAGTITSSSASASLQANQGTVASAITGTIGLIKSGTGLLSLSGSNSYVGGVQVNGGTLQVGSATALGGGALAANGGALDLAGFAVTVPSFSGAAGVVTNSGSIDSTFTVNQSTTTTFSGSIVDGPTNKIALVKGGPGTLYMAGSSSMGKAFSLTGGVLDVSGSMTSNGGAVSGSAVLQIDGNLTANSDLSINSGQLSGTGTINLAGGAGLYIGTLAPATFGGTLSGAKGVEVDNGASLTLTGSNSYGGTTLLDPGGTLVVANSTGSATGVSAVSLGGGTLASGSIGTIAGLVQAGTNAHTIAPGGVGTIGSLAVGGSVNLNMFSTLDFDISGANADALNIVGVLAESGAFAIDLNTAGTLSPSYTLATFASSPGLSFTSSGVPANYKLTATNNDLILSLSSTGPATWAAAGGGSWNTPSMWGTGIVPNGAGKQAVVGVATTGSWTITLDTPQTLGTLTFGNSESNSAGYTLDAGASGSLTLDNSGSAAAIVVTGGSHGIDSSVAVTLNSNLVVSPTAGSTLEIDGNISENPPNAGLTLTLNDAGTLILGGTNTFSGGAIVTNGTLTLTNNEALADGSSLTIGDASSFSAPVVPSLAVSRALEIAPVPEPGTLFLLVASLGIAVIHSRRRLVFAKRKE